MDYGFAPGRTAQHGRVRELFGRRADTTVITRRGRTVFRHLKAFVDHVENEPTIAFPIGNVLLGAHANSEGQLFMPMFGGQAGPTMFETLEQTLEAPPPDRSVAISDAAFGHNPGDPITHAVHFKGCNLGKAEPFIVKFKEALGGNVIVTAPKHFHGITPSRPHGSFEYMAYEFSVREDRDFARRDDLLQAFDNAGFEYIDGTAVPATDWEPLIPRRIGRTVRQQVRATLGAPIGRLNTINVPRQFRVDRLPFTFTLTYPRPSDVPAGDDARRQAFEDELATVDNFQSTHPFPVYQRLGYSSLGGFLDGYRWRIRKVGRQLSIRGTRAEYTVVLVITDRATGHLIFNFHPRTGTAFPAQTTALQETDATFFLSV